MEKRDPVNGGLILGLGIAGLVFIVLFSCVGLIFGLVAWSMGENAVRKLDALELSHTSDRTLAAAGRICGIVASLIYLGSLIVRLIAGPHH